MEFRRHTLPNGLEIVAECHPQAHSTAVGFFVETGARDERPELAGVSHFLEHMMFKGTPSRSAEDVNREFDEMGAHYNAFTSEENTVYYAAVLPEYQAAAVELWADILRPALRESDFETEKQVIIEEIRMYDDQPPFGADDKCRAWFFGQHPLGHSVLGTAASVGGLSAEQMRGYFRERYSPGNIALVGAGRIDFERLVDDAARLCGGWEKVDTSRAVAPAETASGFHVLERPQAAQQYALQMASAPGATDPRRYAAKVLATIVGDDTGSRLYWELVDPGRAEQASLSHYDYQGTGVFMSYLCCAPKLVADNLARVLEIYRQVEREGVTAEELSQAKNKIQSRVVLSSERPRGRLFTVGGNWTQRREYRTVKDDLDAIEAIALSDLAAVLEAFPFTAATTVTIGPAKKVAQPG